MGHALATRQSDATSQHARPWERAGDPAGPPMAPLGGCKVAALLGGGCTREPLLALHPPLARESGTSATGEFLEPHKTCEAAQHKTVLVLHTTSDAPQQPVCLSKSGRTCTLASRHTNGTWLHAGPQTGQTRADTAVHTFLLINTHNQSLQQLQCTRLQVDPPAKASQAPNGNHVTWD